MPKSLKKIPVFFRPEMTAEGDSFSPSAGKPPQVVADWQVHALPIDIRMFEPVDAGTLSLAHDPDYVLGVLSAAALHERSNACRGATGHRQSPGGLRASFGLSPRLP